MFYRYYIEIKNRLSLLFLSGILVTLVSYISKEVLLSIVINCYTTGSSAVEMSYFIFTDVVEVFNVYVYLIFFILKQVLVFCFIYHFLIFISPGLTRPEYRNVTFILSIGSILFFLSVILFKKILFPFSWNFFLSFKSFVVLKSLTLHFEAKLVEYVTFFIKLYYTCVLYFQFFLFPIIFLAYFGKNLETSRFFRKFFYYMCFVFSTLVTPPDITSQIVLSFILIMGCEILVYWSVFKSLLKKNN